MTRAVKPNDIDQAYICAPYLVANSLTGSQTKLGICAPWLSSLTIATGLVFHKDGEAMNYNQTGKLHAYSLTWEIVIGGVEAM